MLYTLYIHISVKVLEVYSVMAYNKRIRFRYKYFRHNKKEQVPPFNLSAFSIIS